MLTELRKKLRNIKRRKFANDSDARVRFEIDTAIWWAERDIKQLEQTFKKLEQLEKQYWKNKNQESDTTNKLAGQNYLRPRLGR